MTRQGLFWEQKEKVMGPYLGVVVQAPNPCTQEVKISLGYNVNPRPAWAPRGDLILSKGDEGKVGDQGKKVKVR